MFIMSEIIMGGLKKGNNRYTLYPCFPVGYIYLSMVDINPSDYFGGTWQRIAKGQMLIGVNENDIDFDTSSKTGGEKKHILSQSEMPEHSHQVMTNIQHSDGYIVTDEYLNVALSYGKCRRRYVNFQESKGNNQSHNNMPPYLTCYMYTRVS